jgi:hypothetical protein
MMNDEETHDSSVVTLSNLEGDIEPGESVSGELVFDVIESSYYELVYGHATPTVSNQVRWHFDADELE